MIVRVVTQEAIDLAAVGPWDTSVLTLKAIRDKLIHDVDLAHAKQRSNRADEIALIEPNSWITMRKSFSLKRRSNARVSGERYAWSDNSTDDTLALRGEGRTSRCTRVRDVQRDRVQQRQ